MKKYVYAMREIPATPWDEHRLNASTEAVEQDNKALGAEAKIFKDGVATDVKNLMLGKSGSR